MITEKELKTGDAFWGTLNGALHVFRKMKNGIFVADNWEGNIDFDKIEFIELIKRPTNRNEAND